MVILPTIIVFHIRRILFPLTVQRHVCPLEDWEAPAVGEVRVEPGIIGFSLHFCWFGFSLALKKPATRGFPRGVVACRVAPSPLDLRAPSVTIQSWSRGEVF